MELRGEGYSCSEATLVALAREWNLDYPEEMLRSASVGLRGGIGATFDEGTCGALTGAVVALGLAGRGDRNAITRRAKYTFEDFKRAFGTVECGAMKGKGREHCNRCCIVAARCAKKYNEAEQ